MSNISLSILLRGLGLRSSTLDLFVVGNLFKSKDTLGTISFLTSSLVNAIMNLSERIYLKERLPIIDYQSYNVHITREGNQFPLVE